MIENKYIAYSDESGYLKGRYRGIALVSLNSVDDLSIKEEVLKIIKESNIKEFKWHKLASVKARFAAINLVKYAVEKALDKKLRIDILTWDTQDSRHNIKKRDDIGNLERMYYHLFRNVLNKRWSDNALWILKPDEHSAINWKRIETILANSSDQKTVIDFDNTIDFSTKIIREFKLQEICSSSSEKEPLIQLADLFVGLGVYSRNEHEKCCCWENENNPQKTLFPMYEKIKLSNSDTERCYVISELNLLCKQYKLSIKYQNNNGLQTKNPNSPINFWWYEPQSEKDKAPTK